MKHLPSFPFCESKVASFFLFYMNNNRIEKSRMRRRVEKSSGRAKKKQKNPCWWHHFYYQNVGIWDKKENSRVFQRRFGPRKYRHYPIFIFRSLEVPPPLFAAKRKQKSTFHFKNFQYWLSGNCSQYMPSIQHWYCLIYRASCCILHFTYILYSKYLGLFRPIIDN